MQGLEENNIKIDIKSLTIEELTTELAGCGEKAFRAKQMYEWICANGLQPVIIATKLDKISRGQVKKQTDMIRKSLKAPANTTLIPFSAMTKQGAEEVWGLIENLVTQE